MSRTDREILTDLVAELEPLLAPDGDGPVSCYSSSWEIDPYHPAKLDGEEWAERVRVLLREALAAAGDTSQPHEFTASEIEDTLRPFLRT